MPEQLNVYNYVNILAFGLSWVLNSAVADRPGEEIWFFNGIRELQRQYESIVNPIALTYLMAHLVLLLEGVFTVTQLLPKFRSSIMVQESVQYWFLASAVSQFLWSIFLGIDAMWASFLSVVAMAGLFVSVTKILMNQAAASDTSQTPEEYWLLRFPFSVHFGWAFSVLLMAINGFFVQLEMGVAFQFTLGFISLVAFGGVAYKMLFMNGPHPNYAVPAVTSWVLIGIALTEQGPKVNFEGWADTIFDGFAALLGIGMTITTGYIYYTKEYKGKELSNSINENDDTVYVSAPEGAMA